MLSSTILISDWKVLSMTRHCEFGKFKIKKLAQPQSYVTQIFNPGQVTKNVWKYRKSFKICSSVFNNVKAEM